MSKTWDNDIYLNLMGILFNVPPAELAEKDLFDEEYKEKYIKTVEDFDSLLNKKNNNDKTSKLRAKIEKRNDENYFIEPCPVAYTGDLTKKFKTVFIALNPHAEPARKLSHIKTWGDLANYHHPNDLINEQDCHKFDDNDVYWRVFGNLENKKGEPKNWSPFYKYLFCLHMALVSDNIKEFASWKKIVKKYTDDEKTLRNRILDDLCNNPVVTFEMIPFKSESWKISGKKFAKLYKEPTINYKEYLNYMFKFIDKYSDDNAYIIMAGGKKEKLNALEITNEIHGVEVNKDKEKSHYQIMSCSGELKKYNNDKCAGKAELYLFKWNKNEKNRTIVVLPGMSTSNAKYRWMYDDVSRGLVQAIKFNNI